VAFETVLFQDRKNLLGVIGATGLVVRPDERGLPQHRERGQKREDERGLSHVRERVR
jgi:hypothetical protein